MGPPRQYIYLPTLLQQASVFIKPHISVASETLQPQLTEVEIPANLPPGPDSFALFAGLVQDPAGNASEHPPPSPLPPPFRWQSTTMPLSLKNSG